MRAALGSTARCMGHRFWMYVTRAGVGGGRDGAVGREIAAGTSRRDVASGSMATMTIPTRTSSPAAMTTSLRRETFEERVSADGIIASPVSLRCARSPYASPRQIRCQSGVNGKRGHWTDLSGRRLVGAQHPEPPAEIGVPDVVGAIHRDAERTGIGPWQTKFRHAAVTQPAQTPTPELAEPYAAVGRHGERGEAGRWRGNRELRESTVREAPDPVRLLLEEPHGAAGIDGHVAEPAAASRDIEFRHLAVSGDAGQPVHVRQRGPDRAASVDRDAPRNGARRA